ncbi:hypothetical protein PtA15_3A765 [Puccinia triticina]|uniref:Golgi apparatus membrane protein TVP23 n=1 Tax=Puccinia triticina TaxID=208348 RepID=A0ABY7CE68_9BASI|nr:uncharacterized protein PtA15_3A765 [Puccinia triticina]WAQ83395.1 hypothetical protein PtA15_3A765 [Puccinia triticina]
MPSHVHVQRSLHGIMAQLKETLDGNGSSLNLLSSAETNGLDSYVFSTVIVVILLSIDFWTVRNVSGRVLVGLRFWNQVDEDGSSYWVFESRDPSQAANAVDSKMFWMALYTFPVAWIFLLFIGILKFNLSFLPIVVLALVFNLTNTIGFTYADRDSKRKWANELGSSGINGLLGQFGGGLLGGLTKVGIGKFFG